MSAACISKLIAFQYIPEIVVVVVRCGAVWSGMWVGQCAVPLGSRTTLEYEQIYHSNQRLNQQTMIPTQQVPIPKRNVIIPKQNLMSQNQDVMFLKQSVLVQNHKTMIPDQTIMIPTQQLGNPKQKTCPQIS